ncbi:procathepsin L-like [Anthonomus grandis grandis]|uniref:procathepsin L-like n=1 Tax=Anthonomus grandis grandis TaxID=2921223 RepID=UPI0021657321|nr:procathepsin L-like [Anthonomus grandis grandis]
MLTKVFAIFGLIVTIGAVGEQEIWTTFKTVHQKTYNPKIEQVRYSIFLDNLKKVEAHNKKFDQGLVSYKMRLNKFADLTAEEFASLLGFGKNQNNNTESTTFSAPSNVNLPESVNWIDAGAVTGVKDQGSCGSCWSFSATGAIEGQYFLKTNKLVSFSEQNLVDCSGAYGDYGCSGGIMDYAFQYVIDNGIMSESDYPYEGYDNTCRFDESKMVTKVASFVDITPGSEDDLQAAVATVGPISVAVDASYFQLYDSGVFDSQACGNSRGYLNHGILAVGYGTTEDGVEYWLVKNSWGQDWGENGYIRMSRNKDNQCGIATYSSYPVL